MGDVIGRLGGRDDGVTANGGPGKNSPRQELKRSDIKAEHTDSEQIFDLCYTGGAAGRALWRRWKGRNFLVLRSCRTGPGCHGEAKERLRSPLLFG